MIRTHELTKRFGSLEAIERVTLEVPEGAVFALVGPNGAGKSTLIRIIMNITRASSGRADVFGIDTRALGTAELAGIAYVSENHKLPEWMPVGYFLNYCKAFYPTWDDGLAAALTRKYELPLERRIGKLSRGMRIKAARAASLAFRPRLIVLDEPFSSLDVLVRDELIETILERAAEATVFLASHDLAEIESFASHIGYLENGRLRFTEELSTLSARFREVEVTLHEPAALPPQWPAEWLNPETTGVVARFVDSQFYAAGGEGAVRRAFPQARAITARSMSLRSIVVALAKSSRQVAVTG